MNLQKHKRILITGADGFIGKNLFCYLNANSNHKLTSFLRSNNSEELRALIQNSDFIFHLAGENRPKDENDFKKNNFELTRQICDYIKEVNILEKRHIPIVMSSSTQATKKNKYGISKLKAEEELENLFIETKNPIAIFRLPGVFGKWSKPNYNSVIATFCNNISQGLKIDIHDSNKKLELVYIDDVIKKFNSLINKNFKSFLRLNIKPSYKVTLRRIAQLLDQFHNSRKTLLIPEVGIGFTRALYSTYLSFLSPDKFSYPVVNHSDERGSFIEFLKTGKSGQISFFTAKPGITRGEHYHHTKTEKFIILKGSARFEFRDISNNKKHQIETSDKESIIVDTIPGWAHNITNIGKTELIVMLWANEIFDPDLPDTYQFKI